MHQTFYIDVDEEISSIIDRLSKSMAVDNYFVVPKRALFLQSIVNLKILKREAEKASKRVVLVTQDEIGISMAERVDVEVRENLDGVESASGIYMEENYNGEEKHVAIHHDKKVHSHINGKQARLNGVGTSEFYISAHQHQKKLEKSSLIKKKQTENTKVKPVKSLKEKSSIKAVNSKAHSSRHNKMKDLDPYKEQSLERLFGKHQHENENINEHHATNVGSKKIKRFFQGFILLCLVIFGGVAAYLIIPSANIVVSTNNSTSRADLDLIGTNFSSDEMNIPVRTLAQEAHISLPYDLSDQTVVSGQKAKGIVTIYNEYSDSPQTLVATTRLKSEDGKIYHIVKNVVVPGYKNLDGQNKPGSVQADVIADQAGDEYNIEDAKFTIPGFEGGPKYEKFYAINDGAIKGGVTDGAQSGIGVVQQKDIDSAKQKAEAAFKEQVNQDIKSQLKDGDVVLTQAQNITITKSASSAKVGSKVSSYSYDVQGDYQAIVFSENDIKKLILQKVKKENQLQNVNMTVAKIDYGTIEPDFSEGTFKLRVHGEVDIEPQINTEQLKADLLGKSDDQLEEVMRKYSSIKKANVEFQPTFITHVPQYGKRVTIQIEKSN